MLVSTFMLWHIRKKTQGACLHENLGGVLSVAKYYMRDTLDENPVATVLVIWEIGSLRNDPGNGNENATNQWFDWLNENKIPYLLE